MAFQGVSRGHLLVRDILEMNGFEWEEEYIFEDLKASSGWPLRFDFMVMTDDGEIDFAIEVNGEQHYEPVTAFGGKKKLARQKHNDAQKRIYCAKHNIPMVEIPYWDIERGKVDINYIMEKAGI